MQLRVLGPIDLRDGDDRVLIGSAKERGLLALLAVRLGRVVTLDGIADELWSGEPPDRSVEALRVYVSHLRRVLPPDGLTTHPAGYSLQVDTDVAQFEELVAKGRAAGQAGDNSTAATLLREALEVWRGRAYSDAGDMPSTHAEAERLEELRLAVLEDRVEADLALGRHRDVVGEITAYVAEYPLRERAWGQLILALYRCGRQADALRAYQQARTKLIDELGIEPGTELRRLEAAILTQDAALDVATHRRIRHNLPAPRTPFIGRERELRRVLEMLDGNRLVTLTGIGGTGKTRLAIEAARSIVDQFGDGVFLVELANATNAEGVVPAVVAALSIEARRQDAPFDRLVDYLRDQQVLLVLDNCEHVVDAVADVCDRVLNVCARVRIIVTSRESVDVPGECAWRVPSLTLPGRDGSVDDSDAVALFCDRARRANATFVLAEDNAEVVAKVCHQLDGIPLALELAAARLRMLTVQQVAARLDDRFRLLTSGGRTALPRHQTLQATMDWSHDLLDEDDRVLLRRLAVFSGSFSLDAVDAVCGGGLDELGRLVDKSLVDVHEGRYQLLETVRQYALDKLIVAGEVDEIRLRHRDWFLPLSATVASFMLDDTQLATVRAERENFMAALAWSLDRGDADAAALLALPLTNISLVDGAGRLLFEQLEQALERNVEESIAARANVRLGVIALLDGDIVTAERFIENIRALRSGESIGEAALLNAYFMILRGDVAAARTWFEKGAGLFEASNDPSWAWAVHGLAVVAVSEGNFDEAEAHLLTILSIARARGHSAIVPLAVGQLAQVAAARGDVERTGQLLDEALEFGITVDAPAAVLPTLMSAAHAALVAGLDDRCRAVLVRLLERLRRVGSVLGLGEMLLNTVFVAAADAATTARLIGAALAFGAELSSTMNLFYASRLDTLKHHLATTMGDAARDREIAAGRSLPAVEAIDVALSVLNGRSSG